MKDFKGPAEPIEMRYKNHRGELSVRRIVPKRIYFAATNWHKDPQWILRAFDADRDANRDFALVDCDFARREG